MDCVCSDTGRCDYHRGQIKNFLGFIAVVLAFVIGFAIGK